MTAKLTDKDKGFRAFLKLAGNACQVRVGVIGNGAQGTQDGVTMAELASIHEFGAPRANIPPRPFLRGAADERTDEWLEFMKRCLALVYTGKMPLEKGMGLVGQMAVKDIRTLMVQPGRFIPLQPETIARKGSSVPLIDTGRLRQSITYEVTLKKR